MSSRDLEHVLSDAESAVDDGRTAPPFWVVEMGKGRLWMLARSDEVIRRELATERGAA